MVKARDVAGYLIAFSFLLSFSFLNALLSIRVQNCWNSNHYHLFNKVNGTLYNLASFPQKLMTQYLQGM